jgi:chemotaxis protein methyltransferase CheR
LHVERFRALLAQRYGWQYDDSKLEQLEDVLRRRIEATTQTSYESYVERLLSSSFSVAEGQALAERLTVPETYFFRNDDHFRALAALVLPERLRLRASEKRLRILSAGCASGEEAYSIAIQLRELMPELSSWDVSILGIDLNPVVLKKAREARYSTWSLRATSDERKHRWFHSEGSDFVVDPTVRQMVRFEERNLVSDDAHFWRSLGCDVVFCRNVLMYFTAERMAAVVHSLHDALAPDGYLFLGHAETLRNVSQEFHLCHTHETFYYQRRGPGDDVRSLPLVVRTTPTAAAVATTDAIESGTSAPWFDAIHSASARIASLTRGGPPTDAPRPMTTSDTPAQATSTTRQWDLAAVLEAMAVENFAGALEQLRALPDDAHQDPDALLVRAVLLTHSGQLVDAEEMCARVLAQDALSAGAHYVLALCREHAGDIAGARERNQTAVYLDASFAMPRLHLGLLARRAGDVVTALRELGQAAILLAREDASRVLLFGGGFSREALLRLCKQELRALGGEP